MLTESSDGYATKLAEMREWLRDWRDGQFSPSYDKDGWPIEMHGLAMDVEWLMEELERTIESFDREDAE